VPKDIVEPANFDGMLGVDFQERVRNGLINRYFEMGGLEEDGIRRGKEICE
jgi:hypothetical protein